MSQEKSISDKYKKLTDVEHVYERPQIYIGSTKYEEKTRLTYSRQENMLWEAPDRRVIPGIMTLFNELINNSFDEYIRSHQENKKNKVTEIKVTIDTEKNSFTVWDNGCIPIIEHTEYKEMLPTILFGSLRSGSNYTEERGTVSGINGVGASLVNVFSTKFTVDTADGIKHFNQSWTGIKDGKLDEQPPTVRNQKNWHHTEITAEINFEKFEDNAFNGDTIDAMVTRCIEIAASGCNPKKPLKVSCKVIGNNHAFDQSWSFNHFWQFKEMFPNKEKFWGEDNERFKFEVGPSESGNHESIALVNSIRCDWGTHVEELGWHLVNYIREYLNKKHKFDAKPQQIRNAIRIYSWWLIDAPEFKTQTKEELATPHKEFGFPIHVSEKYLKSICDSNELIQNLVREHQIRKQIEEKRELQQIDKKTKSAPQKRIYVDKLIDASELADRHSCTLYIVEGDSAAKGFRNSRDAQKHGLFKLRGKFTNVFYRDPKDLASKKSKKGDDSELLRLMQAIGLQFSEQPCKQDKHGEWHLSGTLRYGRICILTDADVDGSSIACQLILLFKKFWPSLIDAGILNRVLTPIVIVRGKKGTETKRFYNLTDYREFEDSLSSEQLNKLQIEYTKGLGRLSDEDYHLIVNQPNLQRIASDDSELDWSYLYGWFGDNADHRKLLIAEEFEQFLELTDYYG